MHFEVVTDTIYTLNFSGMESFLPEATIILEDLKTNQKNDMRMNPQHSFTGSPSDNPERFHVHFSGAIGVQEQGGKSPVSIYSYNKTIFIAGLIEKEKEVLVFSMIGKQILHQSFNQQGLISIPFSGRQGYYIVKEFPAGGVQQGKSF